MFNELEEINSRPAPFQFYTADELWTNEFEENGFKVEELYSDVAGKAFSSESAEIAIVAKKS
jgi:hypothetical protein